jgi:nitroreductase
MDLATVDHLLTTTHTVRKRLDFSRPVNPEVIMRCIEIGLHAPSGGNYQGWHFIVVTDPDKRQALGDLYRKGYDMWKDFNLRNATAALPKSYDEGSVDETQRKHMMSDSDYLRDHIHEAPVHIIACIESERAASHIGGEAPTGTPESSPMYSGSTFPSFHTASLYGSILPSVWSIMLALRSRGLGAAWTTAHLVVEGEASKLFGVPSHVSQVALLPVAYFKGEDFKIAKRHPVEVVTHLNEWKTHFTH